MEFTMYFKNVDGLKLSCEEAKEYFFADRAVVDGNGWLLFYKSGLNKDKAQKILTRFSDKTYEAMRSYSKCSRLNLEILLSYAEK